MRLDVYLFENKLSQSRTEAKNSILDGKVTVSGKVIKKPSFEVTNELVEIDNSDKLYVSRGGLKLRGALDAFGVDPGGKSCIDIGSSSGGFTDCLLKGGALRVICVDSGTNQLHSSLRGDERITVMENCNARYLTPDMLPYEPSLCVMDVSFISATYIIGAVYNILSPKSDFICLIKPQFEVGPERIGKGGIVKDEKARRYAVDKVTSFAVSVGFSTVGIIDSPIKGGDGNVEYLAHFIKP
jgi:23S rRNA (cytidine1920-2'-O)/16S rRNA (cytidine1409-2'-O)-methyltransferase